eukprot:TRINITY_DN4_c0_g1_i13.p1 TRINITY_DN4_c0_g1~~TRINITY_DN4_c0_g1_i13.p1  ORF type:complete len:141 (+),score=2.65 TRINITY_DN4_c0_g1_i13:648-1070(+)
MVFWRVFDCFAHRPRLRHSWIHAFCNLSARVVFTSQKCPRHLLTSMYVCLHDSAVIHTGSILKSKQTLTHLLPLLTTPFCLKDLKRTHLWYGLINMNVQPLIFLDVLVDQDNTQRQLWESGRTQDCCKDVFHTTKNGEDG